MYKPIKVEQILILMSQEFYGMLVVIMKLVRLSAYYTNFKNIFADLKIEKYWPSVPHTDFRVSLKKFDIHYLIY